MAKQKYLYMLVTFDKYELPLIVEETVKELAYRAGVKPITIYTQLIGTRKGKSKRSRYVRVAI